MKITLSFRVILTVVFGSVCLSFPAQLKAQEMKSPLKAPQGWKSETIKLPPGFAKDMTFKGNEHVRFAPGMFKAESDSFFSYVFAFELKKDTKVDVAVLKRELLKYYRGLSKAVLRDKAADVDFSEFRVDLKMKKRKDSQQNLPVEMSGKLDWVEPFTTKSNQSLFLDVQTWANDKHRFVFVCVSPVTPNPTSKVVPEIWNQMRKIRTDYYGQHHL